MAGPEDLATLDKIKTFANEISASYPDAKRLVGLADIAVNEPSGCSEFELPQYSLPNIETLF